MSLYDSTSSIPRPEHPRPDFQRANWVNLNGRWRFVFDPDNVGEQQRWHRVRHPEVEPATGWTPDDPFDAEINVPFPWESALSGIGKTDYLGAAWYQRSFTVPAEWKAGDAWRLRPVLCFGAVDWWAKVWVNGRFAGEHTGGYTPFTLDISEFVEAGTAATITVRAWDNCDADTLLGKQTLDWYTHSSGIWQTVYLEGRPAYVIESLKITPNLPAGSVNFQIGLTESESATEYRVRVHSTTGAFPDAESTVEVSLGASVATLEFSIPEVHAWSPEDPYLYDCTVTATCGDGEADEVTTYFGLRSISRGCWNDNPYEYILLNGRPVYLRGALDQAFYPEGLHTYPTDDAIRNDIQTAKDLGLNMLRCHIKVNDPRYYYWADRLGMLIFYDFPCALAYTETARRNWVKTFYQAIERDYSHPSIIAWILFNETWGLEEHNTPASWNWVRRMVERARSLGDSRLVEDNSPCIYDHVETDINTWHFYIWDYENGRKHMEHVVEQTYPGSTFNYVSSKFPDVPGSEKYVQGIEPLLNSEYAGLAAGDGDHDISYSFKFHTTEMRRHAKICGYVYTELTDIEWEHNGLVNYNRSHKAYGYDAFVPGMSPADINGADFVGCACAPSRTVAPGAQIGFPVFVSHWGDPAMPEATLNWKVTFVDRFGASRTLSEESKTVTPVQFGVIEAGEISVEAPHEPGLLTVGITLQDASGTIRARNYANAEVVASTPLPSYESTDTGHVLRIRPGEYTASSWKSPAVGPHGSKFGGNGKGWVEYEVELPESLDLTAIKGISLRFEAGARTAEQRRGWHRYNWYKGVAYPQTEETKIPSDATIHIAGETVANITLPDDPADSRGVLSCRDNERFELASYGYLTDVTVDSEVAAKVLGNVQDGRLRVRFETEGGLNLYGERLGAYPIGVMVILQA
jgi:hypothetical protein